MRLYQNWNYNAFSVELLARYYDVTKDKTYLDSAIHKCRLGGVLPGQMDNGRFVDPHNAKQVYHIILMKSMMTLYDVLPEGDDFKNELGQAIYSGMTNLINEINDNGMTSINAVTVIVMNAGGMEEYANIYDMGLDKDKEKDKDEGLSHIDNVTIDKSLRLITDVLFESSDYGTVKFKPIDTEILPIIELYRHYLEPNMNGSSYQGSI